jgi:site-specific recombinase XerC
VTAHTSTTASSSRKGLALSHLNLALAQLRPFFQLFVKCVEVDTEKLFGVRLPAVLYTATDQ